MSLRAIKDFALKLISHKVIDVYEVSCLDSIVLLLDSSVVLFGLFLCLSQSP